MGRIKKVATERHTATLSPAISAFVTAASSIPLYQLPAKLADFPQNWPFPRGDLYHWIPLLDRFDHVLELFNKEYALTAGPQVEPFECRLLLKGDAEEGMPYSSASPSSQELEAESYSEEGDRELIESIVNFTRILHEHCGNRSLYASSGHVNTLLHTTSLSLLRLCLKLGLRLAQRFQVARYKNNHPQAQSVLKDNHYAFSYDNLAIIARPYPKMAAPLESLPTATPGKGKERASHVHPFNPSDLVTIAKNPSALGKKCDLSSVTLRYYEQSATDFKSVLASERVEATSPTPTPTRRTSNLGPARDHQLAADQSVASVDVGQTPSKSRQPEVISSSAAKVLLIASDKVVGTSAWALLREYASTVPEDSRYDLLNRVRVSKALATPQGTHQVLLEVRLLAIANLAYALGDSKFQEKVGQADAEEPQRFQLAKQLAEILQPSTSEQIPLSLGFESTVLQTLEALSKSRSKSTAIVDSLQIAVNHGVLYYTLRKVVSSLNTEADPDNMVELQRTEWRESAFDLVNALMMSTSHYRSAEKMVQAGIMDILVEILTFRTTVADRFHEKTLQFLSSFIHSLQQAFQTLANVKGLDMVADLTQFEVNSALEESQAGKGLASEFKSKVVDYGISFHKQSTLRQLFKFTSHLFEHNAGTHDRLLRNLIDTPQMLGALRTVLENSHIFGSNVWSSALGIVSSFIHNEPTSYQVIGEAGLSKSLLESITGERIPDDLPDSSTLSPDDLPEDVPLIDGKLDFPSVRGILPVGETMVDVPTAFGAICLNESGMQLFQASKALVRFFDIFVSPIHVRAMEDEGAGQTAATIGNAFDELSRHHPQLKTHIIMVVKSMVDRVASLCKTIGTLKPAGTNLWLQSLQTTGHGKEADQERPVALPFVSVCVKFLDGFFHNSGMCALFCEVGGAESLLDLITTSSIPYDIVASPLHGKIGSVLKTMCDTKAHLVLPNVLHRLQESLLGTAPLVSSKDPEGFFAAFYDTSHVWTSSLIEAHDGTAVLQSLTITQLLSEQLGRILAPPHFTSRHNQQSNQFFVTLNFTDVYLQIIETLGNLHAACVWENSVLLSSLPTAVKDSTDPKVFVHQRINTDGLVEILTSGNLAKGMSGGASGAGSAEERSVKNIKAIRFLLQQTSSGAEAVFHALSQALTPKRNTDHEIKVHANLVAEKMADKLLWELDYHKVSDQDESVKLRYSLFILSQITRVQLRSSHSIESYPNSKEALTLVLSKFYQKNGFRKMNEFLDKFSAMLEEQTVDDETANVRQRTAKDGICVILEFYGHVVRSKSITEAMQSNVISVRDHRQPDYFMPGQFVVEIRNAILPAITKIWESDAIELVGEQQVRQIIEILRIIIKGEGEDRALQRSDEATRHLPSSTPVFRLRSSDGVDALQSEDLPITLAREAVYRCRGQEVIAREYATLRISPHHAPRFAIPDDEPPAALVDDSTSSDRNPGRRRSIEMADAPAATHDAVSSGPATTVVTTNVPLQDADADSENEADVRMPLPGGLSEQEGIAMIGGSTFRNILNMTNGSHDTHADTTPADSSGEAFVTVNDLNDKRALFRDDLVDRCLGVLSGVPAVTFELSDLIQAAVAKSGEGASPRAEIGKTIVSSLMSLQADDPGPKTGAKIYAYAHLVALILQDRDFFDSTLDDLKEYFDNLVNWVVLPSDARLEDVPYLEVILLIIERVLAEDEQPVEMIWEPPSMDDPLKPQPATRVPETVVSEDLRSRLFDALLEILPKVGKNTSLGLSVARTFVMLTRKREYAVRMSQKTSMSRLFLMIRQMAGSVNEKLHCAFMLILRHMIEDKHIIRQIMKTEIRAAFEGHRSQRAMDTTTYTRNLYHLVLRDPDLFVEITQEMLEIVKFDGIPTRAQSLGLKREKPAVSNASKSGDESVVDMSAAAVTGDDQAHAKPLAPTESMPPLAQSTDGVLAFLLRELSNYKDVEDRPPVPEKTDQPDPDVVAGESSTADVDMTDASLSSTATSDPKTTSKNENPIFKADEHAIYIYRCFILQCLAELLASYTRTKVDFINFSRKPETQAGTPSKPRAGTLNYILNSLVPVGTLEHKDDIAHKKKLSTSSWAITVLVSLVSKTKERSVSIHAIDTPDNSENEQLTFVRKFVLEHALRSFKEATVSQEPIDLKYSRLLGLGEIFNRMLTTKSERDANGQRMTADPNNPIGKLMYEKNFIGALTSAIADLDLNFPNAKRTVKYILGPLRILTDLGVGLSQSGESTTSVLGTTTDEDEIASATSVSDEEEDEDREQTPDLLRNTTLSMYESGANHDDDSESEDEDEDDEDMYDDGMEYDDEMEYEEEIVPEHGDVVSDEDEDIDGMGNVEGVPGDVDMNLEVIVDHGEGESDDDSDDSDLDEDEDDDDEDEDEDEDDDEEEFGDEMEGMEQVTGDEENGSLADHDDDGDWEEDPGAQFEAGNLIQDGGSPHGGALDHIARVIGAGDGSDPDDLDGVLHMQGLGEGDEDVYFEEDIVEEDEEEENVDIADVAYEPELEEDDDEDEGMGFGWDAPPEPPTIIRAGHHHHHHHIPQALPRGFNEMFGGLIGGDPLRMPMFRSHRSASAALAEDDGTNPLLQRFGVNAPGNDGSRRDRETVFSRLSRRAFGMHRGDGGTFIQDLVAAVGPGGPGTINVTLGSPGGRFEGAPPIFTVTNQANGRGWPMDAGRLRDLDLEWFGQPHSGVRTGNDEAQAVHFTQTPTVVRWQEEARMLFGGKHHEKATRIINTLYRLLVPAAMEARKQREKEEMQRRLAEEQRREEARKQAETLKAEREAEEKREREEREAREAEQVRGPASGSAEDQNDMEGVEQSTGHGETETRPSALGQTVPAAPVERITTTIRGREIDISSMGIDAGFLEALPEEMREEVIMQQVAQQRAQAPQTGETPSEISPEFLEALPPDIQAELLRQEAVERRHRAREEERLRASQAGTVTGVPQAEELNNADFIAMLEPGLRQQVLMETDEGTLAALPEDLQAEARALIGDRMPRQGGHMMPRRPGLDITAHAVQVGGNRAVAAAREASSQRRPVAQMLDKPGVATLLRLMFVSLHHKAKNNLHGILSDVCKNTQNRAEVISILLSILQDGTTDLGAVDRSFAQLSLRAKQTGVMKTPQSLKRSLTGQAGQAFNPSTDLSPLNIVQQCLVTMNALAVDNPKVPSFFLTEHETIVGQKPKSTRKAKGRESKANRYPLNALLTLLDRKLITDNTAVMETLASLLSRVTQPLIILLRRQKEDSADKKTKGQGQGERTSTESDVPMAESSAGSTAREGATGQTSTSELRLTETEEADKIDKKKHRDLTPPEVPDENISLVVNILAARECQSKTFSDTLDIIKHLSAIPGAREVFGRELVRQAQELAQTVQSDLEQLASQMNSMVSGTDLQGIALASFSTADTKQRKLLRVLLALDHLYKSQQPVSHRSPQLPLDPKLKDDVISVLYESSTFEKLWKHLSMCLEAIRRKGNMTNVAAILLPLIEALMVVCRNTTLKDVPQSAALTSPLEVTVGTPPPESRMEGIFFQFTEDNRKILNELIRTNPKLMSGHLALLAKNSKMLEFDNKRTYFARKLHNKGEVRHPHQSIALNVRRDEVFKDSFKGLYYRSGDEIKYGKLNIRFTGEEGVDAGGVSREWFAAMARQMFNADYALFNPVASDRTTFHPNTLSFVNDAHLLFFRFIGRIIGKALYEGRVLDCYFSRAVYRRMLGKSVSLKDMESLDLDYYKSLVWILENDITDITFETFSVEFDRFGVTETVDLIENGRNIAVTEENKQEYVRLVVEYRLIKSVAEQLQHFLVGFHEIIPPELIAIFNEQELELLISGLPEIDVDDWKNNTEYHNYQATSPQIQWFWRAVRSFDKEEKAKLLQFVTGTSKVPLNGFKELEGMNGFARFNIHRDFSSKEKLPSSHTCFNQLDLPEYESYEHLRHQLYTAITAGSEYFGFA